MFSLQLKELETSQDSRKLLASERSLEGKAISQEEQKALRSDIQEQEVLLQGYQKVRAMYHVQSCISYNTLIVISIATECSACVFICF